VPTQGDFVFPKKQTVASVVFQCKIICCSFLFAANIVRSDYAIPASHLASLLTGILSSNLYVMRVYSSSEKCKASEVASTYCCIHLSLFFGSCQLFVAQVPRGVGLNE